MSLRWLHQKATSQQHHETPVFRKDRSDYSSLELTRLLLDNLSRDRDRDRGRRESGIADTRLVRSQLGLGSPVASGALALCIAATQVKLHLKPISATGWRTGILGVIKVQTRSISITSPSTLRSFDSATWPSPPHHCGHPRLTLGRMAWVVRCVDQMLAVKV
ncbi:hypothetical protein AAEP93_003230 [Penicillium crustosum]